jgi:tyrosyl-tRNA synthetase
MIESGAVKINDVKVDDKKMMINLGVVLVAQVGKRKFARVTLA